MHLMFLSSLLSRCRSRRGRGAMSYVMPCHAMLCHAMLCYAMLCYAMLCYAILCDAMLCYAILCDAMLCYLILTNLLSTSSRPKICIDRFPPQNVYRPVP